MAEVERLSGNADDDCCRGDRSTVVFMESSKEMEDREEEEESVQEKRKGGDDGLRSQLPELVCVEYPGIVANPEKMIDTLGGLETLAQVLSRFTFSSRSIGHGLFQVMEEPNRRLELRFRPDDVFCKPACGEKHPSSSLLLRYVPFVKLFSLSPWVYPFFFFKITFPG